jgi:CDP-paratose 2-epimerase
MATMLVTGSSGLIGSEVVSYFSALGWSVHGADNNMRADLFGPEGDTIWNRRRLEVACPGFVHHEVDIRDRAVCADLMAALLPEVVVHAAAQPSHDLAAKRPFDDFDINALGTLNLLEAYRRTRSHQGIFVLMSTNKVYGDAPNSIALRELDTRWDYADERFANGIPETMPIDQCTHSLFGSSKLSADSYVQEYGRSYQMYTVCLRGGCLTGPNHSGVEQHGFLSYLVRCNLERRRYRIFGYKGKQVRDNIHSVDVVRAIRAFLESPTRAAVYNIGGGRANSCSILEAIEMVEQASWIKSEFEYSDQSRVGDHICYISDLHRITRELNGWSVSVSLPQIIEQLVSSWRTRLRTRSIS